MEVVSTTLPENTGPAVSDNRENGEGGGGFEEDERVKGEESDRSFMGNRWPQQETLALLKIRSEMGAAFRDTNLKTPLWEEVSRKMAELGYSRSAKKCKEKFENIYKYHRRTKDGRSGRASGKNYRFFEQLEAFENTGVVYSPSSDKVHPYMAQASVTPVSFVPASILRSSIMDTVDTTMSTSTASTSSRESEGTRKKKRKLVDFVGSLMQQVIEKQERWQRQFLEAIEKCEQDRMAREEAWKLQELERIKKEHELLVQERSITAAKDAAVLAFLQKLSEQAGLGQSIENQTVSDQLPDYNPTAPTQFTQTQVVPVEKAVKTQETSSNEKFRSASSSRWPKEEIDTLIRLRGNLDLQYQKDGPKGPLWEEISVAMKKLGYHRSAKRCKEKWENMNKYFRRVKESNKKRPEDSKTCPYYDQLDALYRKKSESKQANNNPSADLKPEELLMHMMVGQERREQPGSATTEDGESENIDGNQAEDTEKEDGDHYSIIANNDNVSPMPLME